MDNINNNNIEKFTQKYTPLVRFLTEWSENMHVNKRTINVLKKVLTNVYM